MIKGRKIESQNITVVVPVKKALKSSQTYASGSLAYEKTVAISTEKIKESNQFLNEETTQGQNHQCTINKQKNTKQTQKQIKKKAKITCRSQEINKQNSTPIVKASSKQPNSNTVVQRSDNQNLQKDMAGKKCQKDNRNKKERIEQVLKNQEAIRKKLNKTSNQANLKKQQIAQKIVKPTRLAASQLTQQQQIQSSSEEEQEEMQRQTLPNPIQDDFIQKQMFALDYNDLSLGIDYQDSSLEQEAFSFLPQKENQKQEPISNLPINMDLFELTADQLLALDYFPI